MASDVDIETQNSRRTVCRKFLGNGILAEYAPQIERVLRFIAPPDVFDAVSDPADVKAAFKRRGLIPPRLYDILAEKGDTDGTDLDILAVCFAASMYPQRASHEDSSRLPLRVAAFIEIMDTGEPVLDALIKTGRLDSVPEKDRIRLCRDLTAADIFPDESDERTVGGALYLATCHERLINKVYWNWKTEHLKVQFMRSIMQPTPSCFADETWPPESWPDKAYWHNIGRKLQDQFPEQPEFFFDFVIVLEKAAWRRAWDLKDGKWDWNLARKKKKKDSVSDEAGKQGMEFEKSKKSLALACRWLNVRPEWIAQRTLDFWELMSDRLNAGLPFYAFLSSFPAWWYSYLNKFYWFNPEHFHRSIDDDEAPYRRSIPVEDQPPGIDELDTELLRVCREGYRLVRSTFFTLQNGEGAQPDATNEIDGPNEDVRRLLDAIWHERIEIKLVSDQTPSMVKDIADRFPDFHQNTISTYIRRLKHRFWAYTMARVKYLTDTQIRTTQLPGQDSGDNAEDRPWANEEIFLEIANLARIVPYTQTLLWAFTARVGLNPLIERRWVDKWSFKGYLCELWHWIAEDTFDNAVGVGIDKGDIVACAIDNAMASPTLGEFVRELRNQQDDESVVKFLQGENIGTIEKELRDLVCGLDWHRGFMPVCRKCRTDWVKGLPRRWIVPVWYLTVVQQLDSTQLVNRLNAKGEDIAVVTTLAKKMTECLTCKESLEIPDAKLNGV